MQTQSQVTENMKMATYEDTGQPAIAYHAVLSNFADLNCDGILHTDLKTLMSYRSAKPVEFRSNRNTVKSSMLEAETTEMETTVIKERHGSEISVPRTHHKVPSFNFSIN